MEPTLPMIIWEGALFDSKVRVVLVQDFVVEVEKASKDAMGRPCWTRVEEFRQNAINIAFLDTFKTAMNLSAQLENAKKTIEALSSAANAKDPVAEAKKSE